ncbi:serine hydrolase domain-containing protein [Erythrobacter rubeus]|uniref:Serine hydrolase n=1 Tax=Erythrobacter rubeus TaxID=2760803 RepID=A0ABR8KY04_9SPHN|nr:serine hydrolase [Erythrobacter rubeus]MBD2843101.1 serine hydrolase [Erythrobacter rubeus]
MKLFLRAIALLATISLLPAGALANDVMERVERVIEEGQLGEVKAVIIEQGGEVLYERYFDGAEAGDRFDIRSAGKSITALALGRAMADGVVPSLDENPLAALGGSAKHSSITLRDLVSMSSALDCNDWDQSSPGQEDKMYPKREWVPHALSIPVQQDYVRDRKGFGRFSYCTAGVFMTGQYIEKQSGERFDTYVQRTLFDPLGITDFQWKRSRSGEIQAGGQIEMRPRDLVKIGRLVLNGGAHGGQQLVPAAWIGEMLTPHVRATGNADYGYLWWLSAFRSGEFATSGWYMSGNGGNMVVLLEELDAVITVVATNYNKPGMHQISRDIIERGAMTYLLERQAAE